MSEHSLNASTVVQQGTRTASRVVAGKAVVVVIDAQELHTLNEVGTRVWELAESKRLDEIAEAIASEYEVTSEAALEDVLAFAHEMVVNGMLEIVTST